MKRVWEKPQLVVLVRTRPEESLIIYCKTENETGSQDPSTFHVGCWQEEAAVCGNCYYTAAS